MTRRLSSLYFRLPVWAQHSAVSSYGAYWYWLRFGPGYRQSLKGYLDREGYSAEHWRAWQYERLGAFLHAAATHVPFYRENWSSSEKAAASAGELQGLPLLEKEPIRADPEAFLHEGMRPWPRIVFATSGSTGTPISTLWSAREVRDTVAVREARSARWAGVSYAMPRATFSGRMVEPDSQSRGPFYRYNAVERQVYFSAFHLRPDSASRYVDALRRHRVRWLTGYAVSSYLLARLILERGLPSPALRAVVTTSEKLTPEMRKVMEQAFGCRVFEEYSTVENALFASECEQGRLHVSPDVGIVEILRPDGTPCEPGEVGEVVTTCLMRYYQPLIRYRLGDLARWDGEPCPCGRSMPVLREVVGRLEDVVVGPDGRRMVRFHGIFIDLPRVREGQVIQEEVRRIRVKVVPTGAYGAEDSEEIARRVHQRLGPDVEVLVEPVESIPRTAAGKLRAVVSLLPGRDSEGRFGSLPIECPR
jgi:phenylacetate-CoA ligase